MANEHENLSSLFTDIANNIRAKKNTTNKYVADSFPSAIASIDASDLVSGTKTISSTSTTGEDVTNYKYARVDAGGYSASVSSLSVSTTPKVTPSISGNITDITSTTASGTNGTDFWTIDPSGSVTTTGVASATGKATISTAGYLSTGNKTSSTTVAITPSVEAGTNRYLKKATSSSTAPTASATNGTASITKNPGASASTTVSGMVTTTTNTGYSVTASASANSGVASATGGSASITAGSITVGVGYNPSEITKSISASSKNGTSASTTEATASKSSTTYIQKGSLSASVSSNTSGSASMSATGFTAAASSDYYVTLSTSSGSVKAKATVGTEGYVKSETNETSATSVSVTGNGNKLYIPAGSVSNSAQTISTSPTISYDSTNKVIKATYSGSKYITPSVTSGYVTSATGSTISTAGTTVISPSTLDSNISAGNIKKDVTILGVKGTYLSSRSELGITDKAAGTYNTSTSDQTISSGQYLTGAQTIKAVTTENISAGNIKSGITIKVGDANSAGRIKNVTGTFTNESTNPITAATVLNGKIGYVNGGKVTGTMTNIGTTTGTISSQGGTYTIPAGYHDGKGTVTASITASSLNNSIIDGSTTIEATNDFAWRSVVTIPAGYHESQTITKEFSEIFPAPDTEAASSQMLAGYQLYDHSGKLITGTMANQGAKTSTISSQGGTYTIPAGYHNGSGVVTASLGNATITSGSATATISDPSYNSTNGNFTLSASGTVGAPTVGTAGYISSTAGTKNTNSISGSKTLSKVGTGVTITGDTTKKPSITRTAKPNGDTWVDAASGAAVTTKPTSGVYVRVDAAANTGTLTATPKVTSAGYGTTSYHGATSGTATVGTQAADATYVPITTTSATVSGKTVSYGTGWITSGSKSVADGSVSVSGSVTNVNGSGNVNPGTNTISKNSNTNVSSSAATTTKPSSGYYVAVDASTAQNTGSISVSGTSSTGATGTVTAGYVSGNVTGSVSGSGTASVTVPAKSATTTYIPITSGTAGTPVASKGSVSGNKIIITPSVTNVTGYIVGSTITGATIAVSASDLVSGTKTISNTSTTGEDVTNYKYARVNAGTAGTPVASKGSVSGNKIIITPSVTNVTGYITGSTITGATVAVSASDLVSGNKSLSSGTSAQTNIDVTNYKTVSISAISSGSVSVSGSVTNVNGSGSVNPGTNTISKNATNTNVSLGTVTTTKPTSGYYVAVDASTAQNTGSISVSGTASTGATGTVTAGYVSGNVTGSVSGSGTASVTVPAKSATTTYFPITTGDISVSGSVTGVNGSGNVNPGTNTISKNSSTNVSSSAATTTKPSGGYYVAVDASTAQNTGSISVSGTASTGASATVSTGGYVTSTQNASGSVSGSGTASVTVPSKSATTTYISITESTPVNNGTTDPGTGYANVDTLGISTSTRYIKIPAGYNGSNRKFTISGVSIASVSDIRAALGLSIT